mgnify:CR=1 FL=1
MYLKSGTRRSSRLQMLWSVLLQVRQQVQLVPQTGQTLAEELVDVTQRDLVIVVAFRRRPKVIREILLQMQIQGLSLLLLYQLNP